MNIRSLTAFAAGVLVGAAGTLLAIYSATGASGSPAQPKPNLSLQSRAAAAQPKIPVFDHIFVIIEENKDSGSIIGSPQAPYLNSLKHDYASALNYHAIEHPSLPNYMDITSGGNGGLGQNNCEHLADDCVSDSRSIADSVEQAGLSWKAYYESMPGACATVPTNLYDLGVNPFVHYQDIVNNRARCQSHVVPYSRFPADLKNPQTLPYLDFITPNLCDDMHNCSVNAGDKWLASHVSELLKSRAFTKQDSLLVITWDESEHDTSNQVPLLLIGPAVKPGYQSLKYYNHYSLFRTIEAAWRLQPLTDNDANAPLLSEFFSLNRPTLELIY